MSVYLSLFKITVEPAAKEQVSDAVKVRSSIHTYCMA